MQFCFSEVLGLFCIPEVQEFVVFSFCSGRGVILLPAFVVSKQKQAEDIQNFTWTVSGFVMVVIVLSLDKKKWLVSYKAVRDFYTLVGMRSVNYLKVV